VFTGLIQTIGTLYHAGSSHLQIRCQGDGHSTLMADIALGDSIAVDGICLTVESILPQGFIAAVSPETLDRTSLGKRADGSRVNLEASLRVGNKIGGHFVTGHIDGQGILETAEETANAWTIGFRVPDARVTRYIVPKGSIAVNGISLTVADCSPSGDWFSVAVIPVTYRETNLRYLTPGDTVNLEGDVLGKYVEKFLGRGHTAGDHTNRATKPELSLEFLAEHGY
jgi:riboflavin synthase